jgi:hypothetical protein
MVEKPMKVDLGQNLTKEAKDSFINQGKPNLLLSWVFGSFLTTGVERLQAEVEQDIRWPDEG